MVRDDFPEVLGAEMSAINGKKYYIPRSGPEAIASWSTRLSKSSPSEIHQMDPLSSPNDLMSPLHMGMTPLMWLTFADMKIFLRPQDEALALHMGMTPLMWLTPADMKIFLRPQDEALEDTWKKAMTMLCYVVHILRDCCEFTDFRQTSFGSTYMTLLGFARVMRVAMPIEHINDEMSTISKESREGLYFTTGYTSQPTPNMGITEASMCH